MFNIVKLLNIFYFIADLKYFELSYSFFLLPIIVILVLVMAFVDDDLEMYMQLNGIVNMEIVNFIDDNEPRRILKQEDPFVGRSNLYYN